MAAARKTASRAATRAPSARPTIRARTITAAAVTPPRVAAVAPATAAPRKVKVLRDSFRIPTNEYEVLETLKQRAAKAGHPAKKSDVLRAGVKVLAALGDLAFVTALAAVPPIKRARPAKS